MPSQDLSRFVIINLDARDPGMVRPPFSLDRLERIGAALTLRMTRQFEYLTQTVMPEFRQRLLLAGWPERPADFYSALFGAAGVALYDDIGAMRFEMLVTGHQMARLRGDAIANQTPEWRRALDYLLTTRTERQRSESITVGELLELATRPMLVAPDAPTQRALFNTDGDLPDDDQARASKARERLKHFGLRVTWMAGPEGERRPGVLIANTHRQLADIFAGSVWGTTPDAAGGGGWAQVLRRAPGAVVTRPTFFRAGIVARAISVPLATIVPDGDGPSPNGPDAFDRTDESAASRAVH